MTTNLGPACRPRMTATPAQERVTHSRLAAGAAAETQSGALPTASSRAAAGAALASARQREALDTALTPALRARGVTTADSLPLAGRAGPPRADTAPPPAAPVVPAGHGSRHPAAGDDAGRDVVTVESCRRAARAGRWIGLATPAAWAAAIEADEGRHRMALELLRVQGAGLAERASLAEREIGELWKRLTALGDAVRRLCRGDAAQSALFGLVVDGETPEL